MSDFKSGQDPFASIPAGVDPFAPEGGNGNGGASPAPAIPFALTENPSTLEQFAGGAKHAWDRAASGLASVFGDRSLQPLVESGKQFVKETGPASTVGQIAGDVAMSAPAALKLFKAVNAARGILPAIGAEGAVNAAYGALTADEGKGAEGAALGAGATLAGHGLGKALQLAGRGAAHVLGATTGSGGESVRQAFRNAPGFVENMRGGADPSTVVDSARQGVHNMRQQMYDAYATAKGGWAADTTALDFRPIGQAYNDAAAKFSFRGTPQPGVEGVKQQTEAVLNDWLAKAQKDPAFLTVEGLDALKRHLSTITPTDVTNRAGRAFVSEVVDAVKASIIKQRPEYADAMRDYWQRSSQLDEIERSLSLGDKATVDTALRKLQSLMRNSVNTNYGQRVQSAHAIEDMGGVSILPQVAGQALNNWTPRGLQGAVAGGASLPSAILAPKALLAMPAMSPRMVGEATRYSGMVINDPRTQAILQALRRSTAPAAVSTSRE